MKNNKYPKKIKIYEYFDDMKQRCISLMAECAFNWDYALHNGAHILKGNVFIKTDTGFNETLNIRIHMHNE